MTPQPTLPVLAYRAQLAARQDEDVSRLYAAARRLGFSAIETVRLIDNAICFNSVQFLLGRDLP